MDRFLRPGQHVWLLPCDGETRRRALVSESSIEGLLGVVGSTVLWVTVHPLDRDDSSDDGLREVVADQIEEGTSW